MHWMCSFSEMPLSSALAMTPRRFAEDIRPEPGETWRGKLSRSFHAARRGSVAINQHRAEPGVIFRVDREHESEG